MRFSIITPTCALQKFAKLSSTHLLLPQIGNPLYWKFYHQLAEDPNQMIILDNGEYEGAQGEPRTLEVTKFVRPSVVVLPDFIKQPAEKTFNASVEWLKRYRHTVPFDFMYVPQCDGTVEDYKYMLGYTQKMIQYFGIRWFGIPRWLAENGFSRAELCLTIKRMNEWGEDWPYVHALGMCNGSLKELAELDEAQCDSIDSSAPVWRGWNGFDIECYEQWNREGTPCNFDAHPDSLTSENEALILSNLRKVGIEC